MTDQEGNVYKTIVIGTQEWMAENLNTSIYRNGDAIATGLTATEWGETFLTQLGAYAYYNDNSNYSCPYGKLYNWYACADSRQICPIGWHVPEDNEWFELFEFVDSDWSSENPTIDPIGGALKSVGIVENQSGYWNAPNLGAINEFGFSAIPSGTRSSNNFGLGSFLVFWSANLEAGNWPNGFILTSNQDSVSWDGFPQREGMSVRCLRD
jgi:uncharacterized protein (TIGR02145 family)